MDPGQATNRRQIDLELRESKALQQTNALFGREQTAR
jgi:hypothetical protein